MENFLKIIIFAFIFSSCKQGELYPSIEPNKIVSPPTVSSIKVEVDKLIVEGLNLENATSLEIKGSGFSKEFTITSKESKKIVAKNNESSSIPANSLLELIISSAGAQTPSVIPITFIPAKDSIDSRSLEDDSVTEEDLDDGAVATEKVQDGAITKSKLGVGPSDNPIDGDVFMWQNGQFELVNSDSLNPSPVSAMATGTVTEIILGQGILGDGFSITDTGLVAVDVGKTGDSSYTKIPYFSLTNELALDSTAKLLFEASPTNFSVSNDGTFKIINETDSLDLVAVEGNGNTTLAGDLVVEGSNFTVGGKTACLSDGSNCPASSGVNSISITDSTIVQGGDAQDVTLAVDVGINPNQIVQLDSSGKLPPVDGSQLLNTPGAITAVIAGVGLLGGGTSGTVTLDVDKSNFGRAGGAQEWKPRLDNLGVLNFNDNAVIIGNGAEFEVQGGITFQDSIRLLPGRDVMAYDSNLDELGNLNPTLIGEYIRFDGTDWNLATIPNCNLNEVLTTNGWRFECTQGGILGPTTTTNNAIARFNGTTGNLIKDSAVIISDTDDMTIPGMLSVAGTTTLTGTTTHTATTNITGQNVIQFGSDVAGKENNAGKMGYNAFSSGSGSTGSLNIVGGGTSSSNRSVRIWERLGVGKDPTNALDISGNATITGTLSVTGSTAVNGGISSSLEGSSWIRANGGLYTRTQTNNGTAAQLFWQNNRGTISDYRATSSTGGNFDGTQQKYLTTGGWGYRLVWTESTNSPPRVRFEGPISAQSYSNNSDARLKKDIQDIPKDEVGKFNALKTVKFRWKNQPFLGRRKGEKLSKSEKETKLHYGLIAQNIETLFPEMVEESKKQIIDYNEEGISELKTVPVKSYSLTDMFGLTVRVLQDANKKIETLEKENAIMKARLSEIEARLK